MEERILELKLYTQEKLPDGQRRLKLYSEVIRRRKEIRVSYISMVVTVLLMMAFLPESLIDICGYPNKSDEGVFGEKCVGPWNRHEAKVELEVLVNSMSVLTGLFVYFLVGLRLFWQESSSLKLLETKLADGLFPKTSLMDRNQLLMVDDEVFVPSSLRDGHCWFLCVVVLLVFFWQVDMVEFLFGDAGFFPLGRDWAIYMIALIVVSQMPFAHVFPRKL